MIKIFVLGDWQYAKKDLDGLGTYVENVNEYNPDYVIVLGDYGSGEQLGKPDGIIDSAKTLSALHCKNVLPILGNHDLQEETGKATHLQGEIESVLKRAFDLENINHVIEFSDFRIFAIGLEPQPENSFATIHECYWSDETIEFINKEIAKRPGVPVIMFTHAPPLGCGLTTVPEVHVRAGNAFLNQNHNPEKITALAIEHDEIIMWFCGHYHLGHHHVGSNTFRFNTHFFLTGLVSSSSRDNTKHSRVIEIDGKNAIVSTYNHDTKKLEDSCSIKLEYTPQKDYCNHKYNIHYTGGDIINDFTTGDGVVKECVLGKNGLLYALTDNNRVWEINIKYGEAMGTLVYSDNIKVDKIIAAEDGIICFTSLGKRLHKYNDPNRFMRNLDEKCSFETLVDNYNKINYNTQSDTQIILDDNYCCRIVCDKRPRFIVKKDVSKCKM